MSKHRADPLPRPYRRLQQPGERLVWLRYFKPRLARWFMAPEPEVTSDSMADAQTLHANFYGAYEILGPAVKVDESLVNVTVGWEQVANVLSHLARDVTDQVRRAGHVVDTDDQIEYTFSAHFYATARVKAWPDEVPGLTSIPWRLVPNGSALIHLKTTPDEVNRFVLPALMHAKSEAERDGAQRVAVLCEPTTARWAREKHLDDYFIIVEDPRQARGALRIATEV